MLDRDASLAKRLVLAALALESVFTVIGMVLLYAFVSGIPFPEDLNIIFFSFVIMVSFSIGFIWLLLDLFLIYRPLSQERVKSAERPALVLGVLQLVLSGIVPGVLLILAYVKIMDSVNNTRRMQPALAN